MKYLFDNTRERQLKLIAMLYTNQNNWLMVTDLASALNYSDQTIKSDLKSLSQNYPDLIRIEFTSQGIRANFRNGIGYAGFQRTLMKESNSHRLLEAVFFNDQLTISKAAKQLNVSESTIYRLIQQINPAIKKFYSVKLQTQPLRVIGEETHVQALFINYFSEKYHPFDWPFDNLIDEASIDSIIDIVLKHTELKFNFERYRYLKIAISVNAIRQRLGYFFEDVDKSKKTQEVLTKIIDEIVESNIQIFTDSSFCSEGIHENLENLFTLFFGYFDSYTFDEEEMSNEKISNQYQDMYDLVSSIEDKYDLLHPNKKDYCKQLVSIAQLNLANIGANDLFLDHNNIFLTRMEKFFPDFYQDVVSGINKFINQHYGDNYHFTNHIIKCFYTYWPELLSTTYKKLINGKGIIISYYETSHAKTQADVLNLILGNVISFDVYDGINCNLEILEELDYDIIIADFGLPNVPGKLVYTLEHIPNVRDALNIYNKFLKHKFNCQA